MSHDANDVIMARNAITSPLLRLPAELRNEIYSYGCCDGTYDCTVKSDSPDYSLLVHRLLVLPCQRHKKLDRPAPSWKGLLLASRQIYTEAASFPYGLYTFYFAEWRDFAKFLPKLAGSNQLMPLLRVEVGSDVESIRSRLEDVTKLPNLKRVELILSWSDQDEYEVSSGVSYDECMKHMRFRIEEWLKDIIDGNFDVMIALENKYYWTK